MAAPGGRSEWWIATILFLGLLLVYSANGREIGSYDTRPTAFAARELVLRGTLSLNHVVGATPAYADRWGILLAKDGRYRSIYSPVSAIEAAALTEPFWQAGLIDINAPMAPQLMAKTAASILVALAVAIGYLTARRRVSRTRALLIAIGLGLGTGLWSSVSQTLWQTETSVLGFAIAVFALTDDEEARWPRDVVLLGVGLLMAGAARSQLAPAIAVLLAGAWIRWGARSLYAAAIIVAGVIPLIVINLRWFGHPLGSLPLLQQVNSELHGTGATFGFHPEAWAGLLVSPSRGIFVFSPIVLVAVVGVRAAVAQGWRSPLVWCAAAMAAQYAMYSTYAVWWGGHTFGPRYMLDILPIGVPLAAAALSRPRVPWPLAALASVALCWSVAVAATGAFCYPNDAWNSDPDDIDTHHARLWSVEDNQIRRCWRAGLSPRNFGLFDRAAVRRSITMPE